MASPAPDTVWLLDQAPLVAEEGKLRLGRDSLVIRNTLRFLLRIVQWGGDN